MLRFASMIAAAAFSVPASAAELAKTGSFDTTTGWKAFAETAQAGDRVLSHGTFWGVATGDNPLGIKTAMCPYISEQMGDTVSVTGLCAWTNAAGDQVFSQFAGKLSVSTGKYQGDSQLITGGSGKLRGIEGTVPHQCQFFGDKGQGICTQHWTYRLP